MKKYGKNAIITVHKSSFSRKRQGDLTTDKGTTEMFEIGNKVAYSPNGVCEIVEISKEKFGTEYREYYVLKPIFDERSKYFVPVDNEKCTAKMRRVASEKDAKKLFENLSAIKGDWIDNEEKRKNFFKEKIAESNLCFSTKQSSGLFVGYGRTGEIPVGVTKRKASTFVGAFLFAYLYNASNPSFGFAIVVKRRCFP